MALKYLTTLCTPGVHRQQERYYGSGRRLPSAPDQDRLTEDELQFIAARDSFYLSTVSEDGWPYLQHRGGPVGFVRPLGPNRLGFADFSGNRQLLSTANLVADRRASLFFMDYPNQERLKLLAHIQVHDAREHPSLANQLTPSLELRSKVERLFTMEIVGFDWNCPQYITPRYTNQEIELRMQPLRQRIAELELQLATPSKQ